MKPILDDAAAAAEPEMLTVSVPDLAAAIRAEMVEFFDDGIGSTLGQYAFDHIIGGIIQRVCLDVTKSNAVAKGDKELKVWIESCGVNFSEYCKPLRPDPAAYMAVKGAIPVPPGGLHLKFEASVPLSVHFCEAPKDKENWS